MPHERVHPIFMPLRVDLGPRGNPPEKGTVGTPVMGSTETVSVAVAATVSVSDPVRRPESGGRWPESGVRLLQRDQANPVTVSDSVTVSVSVSVTGSDAPRPRPSRFHASTGGRPGHGVIPLDRASNPEEKYHLPAWTSSGVGRPGFSDQGDKGEGEMEKWLQTSDFGLRVGQRNLHSSDELCARPVACSLTPVVEPTAIRRWIVDSSQD